MTSRESQPSRKTRKKLAATSLAKEKFLLVPLRAYFQQEPLKAITSQRIKEYLLWRESRQEVKVRNEIRVLRGVGPATLNAELGVLRRILKGAKLWARVADEITPLEEPETNGWALTEEKIQRLLRTASMRPEWETAYLAAVIALNTTKRGGDLKQIRWQNVDLCDKTVTIPKSKAKAGLKTIPLTSAACSAFARLRDRAEMFGQVEPSHFVFGSYASRRVFKGTEVVGADFVGFDPTRPVGSWRSAWRTITKNAGLAGFRFHDLRHTAITVLAQRGHVSQRMLDRYSHVRMKAKREAIEALARGTGIGGYDTNNDTTPPVFDARPN